MVWDEPKKKNFEKLKLQPSTAQDAHRSSPGVEGCRVLWNLPQGIS